MVFDVLEDEFPEEVFPADTDPTTPPKEVKWLVSQF